MAAVGQPLQHHLSAACAEANVTADGRIRVPTDLDAVTTIGAEDHSEVDPAAVERVWRATMHWYRPACIPRSRCACDATAR